MRWPVLHWRRSVNRQQKLIDATLWRATSQRLPLLDGLSAAESARLRELASRFLHEKSLEPVTGFRLTEPMRVAIAAQACLPVLLLGLAWYAEWTSLVVYPSRFVTHQQTVDGAGVVHQYDEVRSGEAWSRGPVVLSWADVQAAGRYRDGYNVVVHEMAHKLDLLNGAVNGFPPLPMAMNRKCWTAAFQQAYQTLRHDLERHRHTVIDAYAAEDPGEFFAVLSELFFELPDVVLAECPKVYQQLMEFYQQDPHSRLAPCAVARSRQ